MAIGAEKETGVGVGRAKERDGAMPRCCCSCWSCCVGCWGGTGNCPGLCIMEGGRLGGLSKTGGAPPLRTPEFNPLFGTKSGPRLGGAAKIGGPPIPDSVTKYNYVLISFVVKNKICQTGMLVTLYVFYSLLKTYTALS